RCAQRPSTNDQAGPRRTGHQEAEKLYGRRGRGDREGGELYRTTTGGITRKKSRMLKELYSR
ncbi:unnamed protein product, partial [Ilex paraguariensis]